MGLVEDLQSYLAAQNLVDGGTGWPSVRRRFHDETAKLVVIAEDGGGPPEIFRAEGVGSAALEDPAVQILVRGEPFKSDQTEAQAQAIWDLLNGKTDLTIGSVTYMLITARTSSPIWVGFDENNRPTHSVSFRFRKAAT